QLAAELKAVAFVHLSDVLPAGFERRLLNYATALVAWIGSHSSADLEELSETARAAASHDQARPQADRVQRLEMGLRLARFLAQAGGRGRPPHPVASQPAPFENLAVEYATEGGFVDWARGTLAGEGQAEVADAFSRLASAVAHLREMENERFARALAEWTAAAPEPRDVVPVESVLERVVAPLAAEG